MVRTHQAGADEGHHRPHAALSGGPAELVLGFLRVLLPDPGQSLRLRRQRRCLQLDAAQCDPGGGVDYGLHALLGDLLPWGAVAVEPLSRFRLPCPSGLLCLPKVSEASLGELVVGAPTTKVVLPEERVARYGRGRHGAVPGLIGGEGELATGAVEVSHGS